MTDSSQLDDIEPPASQVVTIHAGNKTSDICVSSTDHAKTPFKALKRRRKRRRRESSGNDDQLNSGNSGSGQSSFNRGQSLQRNIDSINRELAKCHQTIDQQNEQLAHYRTVLGEVQPEVTPPSPPPPPAAATNRNPSSSGSSSALFPPTPPPYATATTADSSLTGSLTPLDAATASTQQKSRHLRRRHEKRDSKVIAILAELEQKNKDLLETHRQYQNRITQSVRRDANYT